MNTSHLIARMCDIFNERSHRYHSIAVQAFPPIRTITHERVILGTYLWTFLGAKVRLLHEDQLVDVGFGQQVSTEVARDYIKAKYERKFRAYQDQKIRFMSPRSPVLFAKPGRIVNGVYLDIKSAYWTIAKIVGIDVDYYPDIWIGQGDPIDDFPLPDHKIARSSLVSQGLLRGMRVWDGKNVTETAARGSDHTNHGLWAIIHDTLHGIAADFHERCDLRYSNNDGHIIPAHRLVEAQSILTEWGLPSSIKARGWSYVYGVGAYRVGEKVTKTANTIGASDFNGIREQVDRKWLKARIRAFSDQRLRAG